MNENIASKEDSLFKKKSKRTFECLHYVYSKFKERERKRERGRENPKLKDKIIDQSKKRGRKDSIVRYE